MTNSPIDDFLSQHDAATDISLNAQVTAPVAESQNKKRKNAQENEVGFYLTSL